MHAVIHFLFSIKFFVASLLHCFLNYSFLPSRVSFITYSLSFFSFALSLSHHSVWVHSLFLHDSHPASCVLLHSTKFVHSDYSCHFCVHNLMLIVNAFQETLSTNVQYYPCILTIIVHLPSLLWLAFSSITQPVGTDSFNTVKEILWSLVSI